MSRSRFAVVSLAVVLASAPLTAQVDSIAVSWQRTERTSSMFENAIRISSSMRFSKLTRADSVPADMDSLVAILERHPSSLPGEASPCTGPGTTRESAVVSVFSGATKRMRVYEVACRSPWGTISQADAPLERALSVLRTLSARRPEGMPAVGTSGTR